MREHARTWADVGRLPLSLRDRAAMVLALECLRRECPPHLLRVDDLAKLHVEAARDVLEYGRANHEIAVYVHGVAPRLLRARLALALRVLLRVNAGDMGPSVRVFDFSMPGGWADDPLPVRPLWEQAPRSEP